MRCKAVCPQCGEIVRTYSVNNFRHCGSQYSVKDNLLAGETEKFQKMVEKEGKPVEKVKPKVDEKKPLEKIVEKVEEKKNETPNVAPIIVEKVVEPKVKTGRKIKKSEIEEKPKPKELPTEDVYSFGFFE